MMKIIYDFFLKNKYMLMIFVLFIIIRIFTIDNVFWYESSNWTRQILEFITIKWQLFNLIPHFPFSVIIYKIGWLIAGNTIRGIKITHFLLHIITFFMVYKTAFLLYQDKKIANRAILMYTIGFYAYVASSMGIDQDLWINPLLFLCTLYLYKKSKQLHIINIVGIAISGWLLTISRPILGLIVYFIIFLDMITDTIKILGKNINIKAISTTIINYLKIFIPYLIVWWALAYVMYRLFPDPVNKSIQNYIKMFSGVENGVWLLTRISFAWQVFIYTTPLILVIFLLIKRFWKHQLIIISSLIMLLYTYMGLKGGDPARRLMPIMPILMIGIWYVCSQHLKAKDFIRITGASTLLIAINMTINYSSLPTSVNDYMADPLQRIFILSSTIFHPIYLSSILIFGISALSIVLLLMIIITDKKIFWKTFLVFGLGINIFLIVTDMWQVNQPNISKITSEMYKFCYDKCQIWENIYTDYISKDTVTLALIDKEIWQYFSLTPTKEIQNKMTNIIEQSHNLKNINLFSQQKITDEYRWDTIKKNWPGYVFLTYYFSKKDDKVTEMLDKNCDIIKKISNNNYIKWLIYYCNIQ